MSDANAARETYVLFIEGLNYMLSDLGIPTENSRERKKAVLKLEEALFGSNTVRNELRDIRNRYLEKGQVSLV